MPPKRTVKKTVAENSRKNDLVGDSIEIQVEVQVGRAKRKTKKNVETDNITVNASPGVEDSQVKKRGRTARQPPSPSKVISQNTNKKTLKAKQSVENGQIEEEQPVETKKRGRPAAKSKTSAEEIADSGKELTSDKKQSRKTKLPKSTNDTNVEPLKKKSKNKKEDSANDEEDDWQNAENIYEFKVNDIYGKEVQLKKYKGNVCIIVNVASRCGHTKSNYEQFVQLFDEYSKEKGLKILAFPCNQFGKQEPGDSQKICEFAKKRNVKFDMFEKIDVNGKDAHPLWKFLTNQIAGPKGNAIDWNFTKFIIDKEGNVVERHKPTIKPLQLVETLDKYW